jgi:hypothetical protein
MDTPRERKRERDDNDNGDANGADGADEIDAVGGSTALPQAFAKRLRVQLYVADEVNKLEALCQSARSGQLSPGDKSRLERLREGDAVGGVSLSSIDTANDSNTDESFVERYERLWSGIAESRECVALLSLVGGDWPPTPADVEHVYRATDHTGTGAPGLFVRYLVAQARDGLHLYVTRLLADALVCARERLPIDGRPQRWPGFVEPFKGREMPCAAATDPTRAAVDYFITVADRCDTVEVILAATAPVDPAAAAGATDGDRSFGAYAVAGLSLASGTSCDRIVASMPIDVERLCGEVRPLARFLPAFLGAIAAHYQGSPKPAEWPLVASETDGVDHALVVLRDMPSFFDVPRHVADALLRVDPDERTWHEARLSCAWFDSGQLALAVSMAAGAKAAASLERTETCLPSLAEMAAAAYEGPLDSPVLCAEAASIAAVCAWRRACADEADDWGRLPQAHRLVEAAVALGVIPTEAEESTPERLCGRLVEPAVLALMRARAVHAPAAPRDWVERARWHQPIVNAMGRASRLPSDLDLDNGQMAVIAGAIQEYAGGDPDAYQDLETGREAAEILTKILWPRPTVGEYAAWTRLYAADPLSEPHPDDVVTLSRLASRMGINVLDSHRETAGALCGLLALAVHSSS